MLSLALSMLLSGCAARTPARRGTVHVGRDCITEVALTDKTECNGKPGEELHCGPLLLTKKVGCETLDVKEKKK